MRVLIVEPEKAPYEKEIGSSLTVMQAVVGGSIEAVYPYKDEVALVCNEEGKLLGLPLNRALRTADTNEIYDIIAGTFFLCGAPSDAESFASLSEEQIEKFKALFRGSELFLRLNGKLLVVPAEAK